MSEKITNAVILAAGMGSRLGEYNQNKPKGLLSIGSLPIIHESIIKLNKVNIKDIILVTGYQDNLYDSYIKDNFDNIRIVKNKDYENTNTLTSLSKARDLINNDFLLLESDLIYDFSALKEIIDYPGSDVVLLSNESGSGDEVYVETHKGRLVNMSKDIAKLSNYPTGEFVGINKISKNLFLEMMKLFDNSKDNNTLTYEEDALCHCAEFIKIKCLKLDKLLWSEIDTKGHLDMAKKIYSSIT